MVECDLNFFMLELYIIAQEIKVARKTSEKRMQLPKHFLARMVESNFVVQGVRASIY